ncbi:uncharacterized protein LOC120171386 [Hibiscus syriacus]|uniref:uncharacterized protein LOC120171386 n=1 Tax=Hibiscus syriacus TaxID=106335 RepID=UPI0019241BE7|nr:uncharacterized protein LOC120171386 [Hibiscus syriacus]
MKNFSRNRFLVCFRPVMDSVLDSKPVVVDRSRNHRVLTYTKTESSVPNTENSITVHRPGKKTFSHVVKAVVFEIFLAKRVKERKGIGRGSYSSKHDFPVNSHECDEVLDTRAGADGTRETISESNSVPNSEPETSKDQEREVKEKRGGIQRGWSSSNAVFWLLLVWQ